MGANSSSELIALRIMYHKSMNIVLLFGTFASVSAILASIYLEIGERSSALNASWPILGATIALTIASITQMICSSIESRLQNVIHEKRLEISEKQQIIDNDMKNEHGQGWKSVLVREESYKFKEDLAKKAGYKLHELFYYFPNLNWSLGEGGEQ